MVELLQTASIHGNSKRWMAGSHVCGIVSGTTEETTPQGDKPYQAWCPRTYSMAMGSQPHGGGLTRVAQTHYQNHARPSQTKRLHIVPLVLS
jgi:hypothetical protein